MRNRTKGGVVLQQNFAKVGCSGAGTILQYRKRATIMVLKDGSHCRSSNRAHCVNANGTLPTCILPRMYPHVLPPHVSPPHVFLPACPHPTCSHPMCSHPTCFQPACSHLACSHPTCCHPASTCTKVSTITAANTTKPPLPVVVAVQVPCQQSPAPPVLSSSPPAFGGRGATH